MPLWDAYGRPLLNLRIVVTLRCNFRCFFCHREGLDYANDVLRPEDFEVIAEAARRAGITSFKLTGGEPLVRRDIVEIVSALKRGHSEAEVSMTTNGYFLAEYAHRLVDAGLSRVNVSLHALSPSKFKLVTGVDGIEKVLNGIRAAVDAGLGVKLNTVILRGVNVDEVDEFIDFAAKYGIKLQFIELHPVGLAREVFDRFYFPYTKLVERLEKRAVRIRFRHELHNRIVMVMDNGVEVEIVGPTGNPVFCAACTRVRLSPSGEFTPCLNRGNERVSFIEALRSARSRDEAIEAVYRALVKVNRLRRPYFLYTLGTPRMPDRRLKFRLAFAKSNGTLDNPELEKAMIDAWIK